MKSNGFKFAAGVLALTASTALLAPTTASAALVSGTATITIDNTAMTASNFYGNYVQKFWDASYNTSGISLSAPGGISLSPTGPTAMLFPVNTNTTTISYPSAGTYGRTVQATTMDTGNTASGQIGLSGGWLFNGPGGVLTPYDFRLVKTSGTWNISTYDTAFSYQNFLTLTNVSESVNANGQLLLSGNLQWTGLWASIAGANSNAVVGTFNLAPAAVPVPAAVWLFGSGLLGLLGAARRKVSLTA